MKKYTVFALMLAISMIYSCKGSYFFVSDYKLNREKNKYIFTTPFDELLILRKDSLEVKVGSFYPDTLLTISENSFKLKDSLFGSYAPFFDQSFLVSRSDSTYKLDTNFVYALNGEDELTEFPPNGFDIRTRKFKGEFDTIRKSRNYTIYSVTDVTRRIPARECEFSTSYFFRRNRILPNYIVYSCDDEVFSITTVTSLHSKHKVHLDTTGKYFLLNESHSGMLIEEKYQKSYELDSSTVQWIKSVLE